MVIDIKPEALNQISQEIGNRAADELKAIGDDSYLLLKQIALKYIKVVQKYINIINKIEKDALLLKQKRHAIGYNKDVKDVNIVKAYEDYKRELQVYDLTKLNLDNFYQASLIFNEEILSVINNKQTKIAIVFPNAGMPVVLDIPLSEFFEKGSGISVYTDITSKKIPRLAARLKFDVQKIIEHFGDVLRKDSIIGSESLKGLNDTYFVALHNFGKFNPYVIWKRDDEIQWHKIKPSGKKGDISEAYAYFFYTGGGVDANTLFKDSIYNNLDYFFRNGLAKVDSISGLYASDVATTEIDYAVKSFNASFPGFIQMFNLALDILNNKIKTATELRSIADNKKYKDSINKAGEKGLRNTITDVTAKEFSQFGLTN